MAGAAALRLKLSVCWEASWEGSSSHSHRTRAHPAWSRIGVQVAQLCRTRSGSPNTGCAALSSHALVRGSPG